MAKKDTPRKRAKAEKAARREAARRAERRRNLISLAVVVGVVVVGGALVAVSVQQEQAAEQAAAEELEALQSEAAAEAERIANREVACGAQVPAAAAASGQEATPAVTPTTFPSPGDVLEDGVDYTARVETSCGTILFDLAEDRAPGTVNNFVSLARQDFYDGLEIFRNATTIGALQTGSGTNTAEFDIGYTIADELDLAEEEGYPPGAVAMANAGPDTGGSQFFFVYSDLFDEAFAESRTFSRFGTVTEGLDVLERIGEIGTLGPAGETPEELVYIESVEILEDA